MLHSAPGAMALSVGDVRLAAQRLKIRWWAGSNWRIAKKPVARFGPSRFIQRDPLYCFSRLCAVSIERAHALARVIRLAALAAPQRRKQFIKFY